ncbi:alkaline phosphatase family protein [Mucilaginibacter sp. AW1-3]
MRKIYYLLYLLIFLCSSLRAQVKHVVLISVDSFHPDMYLDKSWPCPNLQYLMQNGTYADYLKSVFPAYTYPSHTAMISGALPARSKIIYNQPLRSKGEWYWYFNAIKEPTLWQALKAKGLKTAALMWPVTVGAPIDYNLSELWEINHPDDRISLARKYATPKGFVEELERNATGKLDSTNYNDNYLITDENVGRMAAYTFTKYKPAFMAMHVIGADDFGHEDGRVSHRVDLAMATNDRAIGDLLEAIDKTHLKDSTAIIIVGDHGMATIKQVFRPNILIKAVPAKFNPSGGSCFLYPYAGTDKKDYQTIVQRVTDSLNTLPKEKRSLFRIIDRKQLDQMGADSAALMALTGVNSSGLVFSGSTRAAETTNHGPGTSIQQSKFDGMFYPTTGGHHGYDPDNEEMHTGFIAYGAGIIKGGHIDHLSEPDIAVLIAKLLGVDFKTPDGKFVKGIIQEK